MNSEIRKLQGSELSDYKVVENHERLECAAYKLSPDFPNLLVTLQQLFLDNEEFSSGLMIIIIKCSDSSCKKFGSSRSCFWFLSSSTTNELFFSTNWGD